MQISYVMLCSYFSRFAQRLKSWSKSWTYRGARIRSCQILRSVVAIVLIAELFLTVKHFSTINTIRFFNRNYHRVRSFCIITKRDTAHHPEFLPLLRKLIPPSVTNDQSWLSTDRKTVGTSITDKKIKYG